MSLRDERHERPVAAGQLRLLRETSILLAAALLLAVTVWALRTPRLPLSATASFYEQELAAPVVTIDQALVLYETHHFVDTRPDDAPADPGIRGAFRIRAVTFADDFIESADFIYPEDSFVLYGDSDLQRVSLVATRFIERGYLDVKILAGGLEAWRRAGGPVTGEGGQ